MPVPREASPREGARYTFADYLTWDEGFRYELIDGVCYVDGQACEPFGGRPAALAKPSIAHQRVSRNLLAQLHRYLEGRDCEVLPEIDVVPCGAGRGRDEITTVLSPDLSVVCDKSKLDENHCFGAPDMVVEILSRSTMRNDRIIKYNIFQSMGVREYWIVDPATRSVQVFLLEGGVLRPFDLYGDGDMIRVNVLDGCRIELSRVFAE